MAAKKATKKTTTKEQAGPLKLRQPNYRVLEYTLIGWKYVTNAMAESELQKMIRDQETQKVELAKIKAMRRNQPRDFNGAFESSKHIAVEDAATGKAIETPWPGIPCMALKSALVRAASLTEVEMTKAKMVLFVHPDGVTSSGSPLIKINGTPHRFDSLVRTPPGPKSQPNVASRAMWDNWTATVRIEYDADFLTAESVTALLVRAGKSVGIGAGRTFSSTSCGMGWGTFKVGKQIKQYVAQ